MKLNKDRLRWDGVYTTLLVLEKIHDRRYEIWLHGNIEELLMANNVTFTQNTITVFNFTGKIFAGKSTQLNLKIYEQDNGVVRGEITVIEVTE